MNKVTGGIIGAALGFFLLGTAGYALGYLYLGWFGPEDCCGLEGLYPLIVGVVTGTPLGITVGALTGVVLVRRHPLKIKKLGLLISGGVGIAYVLSLLMGAWSVEDIGPILFFLALTLFVPVIVWVTDIWEKPDTTGT